MTQGRRYWLMKSEPRAFSIEDLEKSPKQTTCWDGVRNYQARNFMRAMAVGDRVFFTIVVSNRRLWWGLRRSCGQPIPMRRSSTRPATTMTQPVFPLLHDGIWWTSGIVKHSRPVCRSTD